MKDQIVTGVRGQDTRQDLLKIQGFNLQKGTDTCRAAEQSQAMKTEFAHVMSETKKNTIHEGCQFCGSITQDKCCVYSKARNENKHYQFKCPHQRCTELF